MKKEEYQNVNYIQIRLIVGRNFTERKVDKFTIAFWLTALAFTVAWMLFVKF